MTEVIRAKVQFSVQSRWVGGWESGWVRMLTTDISIYVDIESVSVDMLTGASQWLARPTLCPGSSLQSPPDRSTRRK